MPTRENILANCLEPVSGSTGGLKCLICCDGPTETLVHLPCHRSHIFCIGCITEWLRRSDVNTCPLCRAVLFEDHDHEYGEEDDYEDDEADENEDEDEDDGVELALATGRHF